MEQRPAAQTDEIDLYVRTYNSLLRSSGRVRVRAFEEAHAYSNSSLHPRALSTEVDVSAFAYAAARLPEEMIRIERIVLGQSHELFEAAGFKVRDWETVKTRGRRRPLRWDKKDTLAVFIASVSDIDDLVPIITAYQIEWNKLHGRLRVLHEPFTDDAIKEQLGIDDEGLCTLRDAFGDEHVEGIRALVKHDVDFMMQMLSPSYSQFQRAAQRWWSGIEPSYIREEHPRRPPVYFISSNTHAIANLVGGYSVTHKDEIIAFVREKDPEGLRDDLENAIRANDEGLISNFLHYFLRAWIHSGGESRMKEVRAFESEAGLLHLSEPGHIDVDAQLVDLNKIDPHRLDPRLLMPGLEKLLQSDALILNIDYPLGMAAYHLLSRVGQGTGEIRGIYIMGKAATLNGRVGDVMLSGMVYDEHTRDTFIFENALRAADVEPHLKFGNVFDNQSALTVRSAFLQNREYMNAYYREGYTVLEMESGPFLSAAYELAMPTRVRTDEIIALSSGRLPCELGLVHYASDTPYSRRQSLLSKSLSYFGVDSTYACAIAIVRRILQREIARIGGV